MDTELSYAVQSTEAESQYDEQAKRLLGHKSILSHILIKTVEEFKGMNPREVEACIEGEPIIGKVPMELGLTNQPKLKEGNLLCEQTDIFTKGQRFCQKQV